MLFRSVVFILIIGCVYALTRGIGHKQASEVLPKSMETVSPKNQEVSSNGGNDTVGFLAPTQGNVAGISGTVREFDADKKTLSVESGENNYSFIIGKETEIFKDGVRVDASDIVSGDNISVLGRGTDVGVPGFIADSIYLSEPNYF